MKDIECPLCGGVPQFATKQIDEIEVCQILCKCGLATEINEYWLTPEDDPEEDELRAWKDWRDLVSKFPPIMRVQAGDKILYNSCDDDYLAKVNDMCRDKNNDVYLKVVNLDSGDEDDVEAYQIIRWPWELEQKGEQEQ